MALLLLAATWARRRGRRLIAITVDHGLNPDSPAWSEHCRAACALLGVEWIERRWTGNKPANGLTAAARTARHALVADAARRAGARVVLMAHTADDIAEADWMRAQPMSNGGSTLGTLREWGPSPAWPQGRGLMLFRPLLGEGREELRQSLRSQEVGWIDDPANSDERFGRARARHTLSLLPLGEGGSPPGPIFDQPEDRLSETDEGSACQVNHRTRQPLTLSRQNDGFAAVRSSPLPLGEGFAMNRSSSSLELSAAILSTSGSYEPPRAARLDHLSRTFASPADATATLSGTRIVAQGDTVLITREPGDLRRRPVPDIPLQPGIPAVWDGRYELTIADPGWIVTAALNRLAAMSDADRAIVKSVVPWARGALPILVRNHVLIRDDGTAPVLAWRHAEVRALAPRRLALALAVSRGETTQESELGLAMHGETPPPDLF